MPNGLGDLSGGGTERVVVDGFMRTDSIRETRSKVVWQEVEVVAICHPFILVLSLLEFLHSRSLVPMLGVDGFVFLEGRLNQGGLVMEVLPCVLEFGGHTVEILGSLKQFYFDVG